VKQINTHAAKAHISRFIIEVEAGKPVVRQPV